MFDRKEPTPLMKTVLKALGKRPIHPAALSEKLKLNKNNLYQVLLRLRSRGLAKNSEAGWVKA